MNAARPHVALIVETSLTYGRQILRGIIRYLRSHGPWSVFSDARELAASPPSWLRRWPGDGIICRSTTRALAAAARRKGVPLVNLNDVAPNWPGLPYIESDHAAIGRLAAAHLLERGFRHFAFCGFTGHEWSGKTQAGFTAAVAATSAPATYTSPWGGPLAQPWEKEETRLADWLRGLPRPLGVLACNDLRGQHVIEACARVGLRVPEEIAVVGVDDDVLLCELCDPPLSSVVPNAERVGYEAAALLDRLMAGGPAPEEDLLVFPLGITTRQSTDVLAIEDAHIATAVRYIREHACRGATVGDVLAQVPLSRTMLERGFRKYLGRSPQQEIRAIQLKRVKQLLADTNLKLVDIAERAGFKHPEYLNVVFKREAGQTPGEYRRDSKRQQSEHPY
jgi:LacI family transcriptional regulator